MIVETCGPVSSRHRTSVAPNWTIASGQEPIALSHIERPPIDSLMPAIWLSMTGSLSLTAVAVMWTAGEQTAGQQNAGQQNAEHQTAGLGAVGGKLLDLGLPGNKLVGLNNGIVIALMEKSVHQLRMMVGGGSHASDGL